MSFGESIPPPEVPKRVCRMSVSGCRFAVFFSLVVCLDFVAPAVAEPTYWQDVRPALRKYCTVCHSTRNLKEVDISGGFTLDSYAAVVRGTKKGMIHPGKSGASRLIQVV